MKKSKKNNPNPLEPIITPTISVELLDWYTDPEAGYWSPLLTDMKETLMKTEPIKKLPETLDWARKVQEAFKLIEAPAKVADTPEALAEHYKMKLGHAAAAETTAAVLMAETVALASIPVVRLADAVDEMWRFPYVQAEMSRAYSTLTSLYDVAQRPLIQRHLLRTYTPLIPETYRLATAATKGILADPTYKEAMAQSGLNSEWADMWREENYEYPTLGTAIDLLRRGHIDEKEFDDWFERRSWKPEVREAAVKLREFIPPVSDLRTMAVREAFPVETREEQYAEMLRHAKKMGLDEYWRDRYLYAGYRRMDVGNAAKYFLWYHHEPEDYKRFLGIADVHPDDQPRVTEVSYTLPTIREMGYGYDVGVYTEENIRDIRRKGGLSVEDAEKAAGALVDYRLEAEREALRREWMHLFAMNKLGEDEFRTKLNEIFEKWTDRTELWLERGRLERQRRYEPAPEEYRPVTSSEAKWAFVNDLRDEKWYRLKLSELGWDEERITVAVERAQLEIERARPVEEEPKYRDLTVGQITDLYRFKKIPAEELSGAFEGIGYSVEDAALLSQVIMDIRARELEPKAITEADIVRFYDMRVFTAEELPAEYVKQGYTEEDAERKSLWAKVSIDFPDLRSMYSKGWITADVLVAELRALGLSKERAADLAMTVVKLEAPSRVEKERDLTKSEIVKGVKAWIITPSQAVRLLMDLGYEEWEAWYILAINKIVVGGDPEGYWEMKKVTEAYKKAVGKPSKDVPDDLLVWEQRVKDLRAAVRKLTEEKAEEDVVAQKAIELNEAEANYRRLIQDWERLEP